MILYLVCYRILVLSKLENYCCYNLNLFSYYLYVFMY